MLCDLALIYQSFCQPLPGSYTPREPPIPVFSIAETYEEFKAEIHQIFPVIIDTKHLCFAVQKVYRSCWRFPGNLDYIMYSYIDNGLYSKHCSDVKDNHL